MPLETETIEAFSLAREVNERLNRVLDEILEDPKEIEAIQVTDKERVTLP